MSPNRARALAAVVVSIAVAVILVLAVTHGAAKSQDPSASPGGLRPASTPSGGPSATPSATTPAGTSDGICTSAKDPQLAAKISSGVLAALHGRDSVVGLTVSDPATGLTCALHQTWHFDAASVIKATIISALLLEEGGPSGLSSQQQSLATLMITQSDDNSATALWNDVGMAGMQNFLIKAGMVHTELNVAWGLTKLTAQDEMTLLGVLTKPGDVLSTASRDYVLSLMANVVPSQRWGTPYGAPSDVTVHVKNGWLPYPGDDWHINSIGAFTAPGGSYLMAILTSGNDGSEEYGIDTVQAAAGVVNKDLASS